MAATEPRQTVRTVSRWTLSLIGIGLLGVLALFAESYTDSIRVFLGTLVVPLASVAVLGGLGYYIASHEPTVDQMNAIFKWTVLGASVLLVVVGWYQLLDVLHEHNVPLVVSGVATVSIGGAMGAVTGWYNVRARETVEEAAEARARESHLEQQRETMALIDRTLRHHLLNGLNIVQAHVGLLEEYVADDGMNHLRTVQNQAAEMIATIEELREFSEMLYDQDTVEQIDLSDVIRTELDKVRQAYPDAVYEIRELPDSLPVEANRLLTNVVSNLLHNAVQHNDSSTPRVWIDAASDGDTATVRICDNGPGIPADRVDELFEMGERGEGSEGSGMGLFLARAVVERLDGHIWVADDDSDGATVAFELPIAGGEGT